MIFYKYRQDILRETVISIIILIIAIMVLQTSLAKEYIDSFRVIDASYTARISATEMYLEQLYEKPIFGVGFIRDMENSEIVTLLRGSNGTYTRTDVGIIGFANCFGIVGLIWYIYVCIKMLRYIIKIESKCRGNIELIGIYIFIILNSATLIVMDAGRIIILPIFMSMINTKYYECI